jgi:O-acetyl-ADP-ribose deacetylase (regulator of RNase III)
MPINIIAAQQNLLSADVEALVNTVNCVGAAGKGIAVQFREKFPDNYLFYRDACRKKQVKLGKMLVFQTQTGTNPKFIINFPTKWHFQEKSSISSIIAGLEDMVAQVEIYNIRSLALPALGCGYGGLDWRDVYPLVSKALSMLPATFYIFEPGKTGAL